MPTTAHASDMPRPPGLAAVAGLELSSDRQDLLNAAAEQAGGSPVWRNRKVAEAHDLLALSQVAPRGRMWAQSLDLSDALRAIVFMRVPTPVRIAGSGPLLVAPGVVLGLTYPPEALRQPLPGFVFVQILQPDFVWHANVAFDPVQPVCLGARLPAGVRVLELILMTYGALSLQTVMIDEADPAGVLNAPAAVWWQEHRDRIPLTRVPFLGGADLDAAGSGEGVAA